ncbi:hypothetical protein Tco_0161911 [Tanacetum coccineum]
MQDMLLGVLSTVLILLGPTVTNSSSLPVECRMTVNSSVLHSSSGLSMLRRAWISIGEYSLLIASYMSFASLDFSEFYKELEAEILGAGAQLMGLQFLQLVLRLGKNPSRSFRPVKSAEILWQFWTSYSLRVSLAQDDSWSKWEPSLWLCG